MNPTGRLSRLLEARDQNAGSFNRADGLHDALQLRTNSRNSGKTLKFRRLIGAPSVARILDQTPPYFMSIPTTRVIDSRRWRRCRITDAIVVRGGCGCQKLGGDRIGHVCHSSSRDILVQRHCCQSLGRNLVIVISARKNSRAWFSVPRFSVSGRRLHQVIEYCHGRQVCAEARVHRSRCRQLTTCVRAETYTGFEIVAM
jgi:hypothetical protein